LSTALKVIIGANVVGFLLAYFAPEITFALGLRPVDVVHGLAVWQLVTYMFLHGGIGHLVVNMLTLWMFGTELEALWGTRFFVKYYMISGIGAGVVTVLFSLLPFTYATGVYLTVTVGASGAVFALLLAYGLTFPNRLIHLYMVFPIPAKYFVLLIGAISFFAGGAVAHVTHAGGVLVGYLLLKMPRLSLHPVAEVKYRYLKWKINRVRKKFDVYSGGRADDWDRHVH
jgi:membrane associated rhomboid family serine protease